MLWHILKYYMCFVIGIYFKRHKIKNAQNINVKGPVVLAMNHPNAFMDPVAFSALVYPPRVRYLARGDAFKKGIITWLLDSLGIIPIFRIQDGGKEGLKKNDETYERVNYLLKHNKKIIIFAEGLCIQERRLRTLKKGVPRMVFGAMEEQQLDDLIVVPVGVNYSNPSKFRSNLFFNIGSPIKISDYMASYKEAPAKTMNKFLADLAPRMKELIIHINLERSEKVIEGIEKVYKSLFFKNENLDVTNLEHDFIFSTKVTEIINKAEDVQPEKVEILKEKIITYFESLEKFGLKDWLIDPIKQPSIHYLNLVLRILFIVLTFPIYIIGLIGNYIPYKITELITTKKVKAIEFKASFNMGIGAFLFLIFYILQFFIAKSLLPHVWWALFVILLSSFTGLFSLYFSPYLKKTKGMARILKLKSSDVYALSKLQHVRQEIIMKYEELI